MAQEVQTIKGKEEKTSWAVTSQVSFDSSYRVKHGLITLFVRQGQYIDDLLITPVKYVNKSAASAKSKHKQTSLESHFTKAVFLF